MVRFRYWKLPVAWLVLVIAITPLFLPPDSAGAGPGAAPQTINFSGHVYVTGSRTPIAGVTVQLWTARTGSLAYHLAATTQTGARGAFEFKHGYAVRTDYEIRETNLSGYASTGAIAPGGSVITDDIVRYVYPSAGTYSGIIFYDTSVAHRPTPTRTSPFVPAHTPTPTRTTGFVPVPSPTPTRTTGFVPVPTATRTPVTTDLWVTSLEVTQAIQDLANSVPLIARKRTFVRAHVRANDGNHAGVWGQFRFERGPSASPWYTADNPGGRITVREYPGRGVRDHSFFIEVPPSWIGAGELRVWFRMNTDSAVPDTNIYNNVGHVDVSFVSSPPLRVKIFNVTYVRDNQWHAASWTDIARLVSWLRRAYPVPSVDWQTGSLVWAGPAPGDIEDGCSLVNFYLWVEWVLDGMPKRRYYGLVADSGKFMRGCSNVPSHVASGPTGPGNYGWDYDGSYGDWYGGHELGHSLGRPHVACQGNELNPDGSYPYPGGLIGIPTDPATSYGWDVELLQVYPPYWTDVMSYCKYEWISPYTYQGIRNRLNAEGAGPPSQVNHLSDGDVLAVLGTANLEAGTAQLKTLYHLSEMSVQQVQVPSHDWALVLYGVGGGELARHPFTPAESSDPEEGTNPPAAILETIPWVDGSARVVVEYEGHEVAGRTVSAHAPMVTLNTPNGGEVLDGPETTVRWTGSDEDGDALVYALQYSADTGATWQTVAVELQGTEHDVPLGQLPGSDQALFRVMASDGVNTGRDESDGTFRVLSKPPQALIISPSHLSVYGSGQQIVLVGEGYDVEDGILGDGALRWRSDLAGDLGTGTQLAVDGLGAGKHTITLTARDSDGQAGSDTTIVYVDTLPEMVYLPLVLREYRGQ
jgi:hypothetical protein